MTVDWSHFTPFSAAGGGLLIGLSAVGLILLAGRMAGISGISGGLLPPVRGDAGWRLAFLAGLIAAPAVYSLVRSLPSVSIQTSAPVLIIAGLLVGIGTRYAAGCTSGHGICGLSRLSSRSLAAVVTFMAAGFVTVFVMRHVLAS
jgi:uncharacterized membrane protein YedE/YeeE